MSTLQQVLMAVGGAAALPAAELLLHMEGSNAGTTFTDSSPNVRTVTPSGSITTSTARSQFGTASALCAGGKLTVSGMSIATSGDFTFECWVFPTAEATIGQVIYTMGGTASPTLFYLICVGQGSGTGHVSFGLAIGTASLNATHANFSTNAWHHVAVSRSAGTVRLFVDGAAEGSTSSTFGPSGIDLSIGANSGVGNAFAGNIDDFRFVKAAVYTSAFTPAGPLT